MYRSLTYLCSNEQKDGLIFELMNISLSALKRYTYHIQTKVTFSTNRQEERYDL